MLVVCKQPEESLTVSRTRSEPLRGSENKGKRTTGLDKTLPIFDSTSRELRFGTISVASPGIGASLIALSLPRVGECCEASNAAV